MTTTQPGKKKALLIGINYENNDELCLFGPHQDVVALKKLLREVYEYEEDNILVMLDGKGHDRLEPTNVNILREINNLVRGAQPGDHFLFYYSGHSEQIANLDHTEEDNLDEGMRVLVPCDQEIIVDNQLRKCLVDPLPIGSTLVAIFDSCHSGTLLDLDHFRCNRVYTPWKFNGTRRWSDIKRAGIVRRLAIDIGSLRIYENRRVSVDHLETKKSSIDIVPHSDSSITIKSRSSSWEVWFDAVGSRRASLKTESSSTSTEVFYDALETLPGSPPMSALFPDTPGPDGGRFFSSAELPIQRCESPSGYCPGFCDWIPDEKPNVICLSASQDFQRSWECEGHSMTTAMIGFLREDPHPSLNVLMGKISHYLYDLSVKRHELSRELKKKCRDSTVDRVAWESAHEAGFDIEDYQDPQVSSLKPLDMQALFTL